MEILVRNELEKKAIEALLEVLHDEDVVERFGDILKDYYELDYADLTFLETVMGDNSVKISDKSYQAEIQGDRFIGNCSVCGVQIEGLIDGIEPSLENLKDFNIKDHDWKCETCYFKGDE